jgi:hypothetical protein
MIVVLKLTVRWVVSARFHSFRSVERILLIEHTGYPVEVAGVYALPKTVSHVEDFNGYFGSRCLNVRWHCAAHVLNFDEPSFPAQPGELAWQKKPNNPRAGNKVTCVRVCGGRVETSRIHESGLVGTKSSSPLHHFLGVKPTFAQESSIET